jgi:hypothetical protein
MRWGGQSFLLSAATLGGVVWMSVDAIDNAIGLQLVARIASVVRRAETQVPATSFIGLSALLDCRAIGRSLRGRLWVARSLRLRAASRLAKSRHRVGGRRDGPRPRGETRSCRRCST